MAETATDEAGRVRELSRSGGMTQALDGVESILYIRSKRRRIAEFKKFQERIEQRHEDAIAALSPPERRG